MLKDKKTFLIIITLIAVLAFASCSQASELMQTNSPTPVSTPVSYGDTAADSAAPASEETPTATPEITEKVTLVPTAVPETSVYIPHNQDIMGLYIGMRLNEAETFAGKYDSIDMQDARDAISAYQNICTYPFGTVGYVQAETAPLSESWIYYISVDKPGYEGPLGIKVGDSFTDTIDKLGISDEYFSQEYNDIYADGSILGYIYLSDSALESWQVALYFGENELRTFFINLEEGKVVSFGVVEQLN
ncbi:MAG: hypothetical protein AB1Z23_06575 [Eubacteriales bacterium]